MTMLTRLLTASAEPADEQYAARLLSASLWSLLVWAVVSGTAAMMASAGDGTAALGSALTFGSLALAALGGQWLARSGHVRIAGQLLVGLLYVGFTLVGATRGASLFLLYALLVLITGLTLGRGVAVVVAVLSAMTGLCVIGLRAVWGESARSTAGALPRWLGDTLALGWAAWLVFLAAGRHKGASGSVGRQGEVDRPEPAGDDDSSRLAQLARRNHYLQAVASIAQHTARLVDEDELLSRCADLAVRQLSLSQAGIYLVDPSGEQLDLRSCAFSDDRASFPLERSIPVGQSSLVGRVLHAGRPALWSEGDAAVSAGEQSVPPGTQAEIALPLRIDGELVGVLDLHSPVAGAFSRDDAVPLQMLADQIGVAIRAARTFSLVQQRAVSARAERRESAAEEWRTVLRARRELAVVRNERGLYQAQDVWRSEMSGAMASGDVTYGDPNRTVLAAPIWVRDQVIGVIDARKPAGALPWSHREVALVKALCAQLGQALENARLYESVQRGEERERLLGQATARMRESLDVETVLRVAVEEIRHALGLAALDVRLQMDGEADD
jgi:GAF domain-containing protein